nr:hypothetical protein CFP56_01470 [Quercus suber]
MLGKPSPAKLTTSMKYDWGHVSGGLVDRSSKLIDAHWQDGQAAGCTKLHGWYSLPAPVQDRLPSCSRAACADASPCCRLHISHAHRQSRKPILARLWSRIAPQQASSDTVLAMPVIHRGIALQVYWAICLSSVEGFLLMYSRIGYCSALDLLRSSVIRRIRSSSWFLIPNLYSY